MTPSIKPLHTLIASDMPGSHLKIMFLLVDMCNDWGFTTESYGSLSEVFNLNKDNLRKRVNTLIKQDMLKIVSYNGRKGLMVNPIYCNDKPLHLKEFREALWEKELILTRYKPRHFYGPPFMETQELAFAAVKRSYNGSKHPKERTRRIICRSLEAAKTRQS